ncbi:hypothetical protein HMPREF1982_02135, partial [Clostridiales bacterium oral taxon 876 str. F0540]
FYLNYKGYKVARSKAAIVKNLAFYLNYKGYKVIFIICSLFW